ncbi:aldehyde dehydrogenase family protein [Herbiconiux sp. YIM B11900]|uniref:aldehyde dehydrogenase family protein n=1 Tax=Herbiconiux sp. YIM B11900 TaxID=3404131 RepID=UPI003F842E81
MTENHAPVIRTRSFIEGAWRDADGVLGVLSDPNTGETRCGQLSASLTDVEDALSTAQRAYDEDLLQDVDVATRVQLLEGWAARLDEIVEEIALQDAVSTGNPIRTTRILASSLGTRVRGIAEQARALGDGQPLGGQASRVRLLNRALGPTLVLAPWNAPTFVAVSKVAAALGAGSPVILKPSEWTPSGAQVTFEHLVDTLPVHGVDTRVAQLVHGAAEVGSALSNDPRVRVITFTGGLTAGRAVARAAAENLAVTQLELGSNNPAIVLPDADIAATARHLISGMTRLNGQWCEAPGKVLAPAELHDDLLEALLAEAETLRIRNCFDNDCDLGPLAYRRHRDRLEQQLAEYAEAGAQVHRAGTVPELDGWFFAPAVVSGLPAAAAADELFGPALTLHMVPSVEEAIVEANRTGGGLDGFVFGRDEDTALKVGARVRAGEVRINGTHMADLADGSEQTFWDTSGVGGHGPAQGVAFYQGRRVVGVDSPDLPL